MRNLALVLMAIFALVLVGCSDDAETPQDAAVETAVVVDMAAEAVVEEAAVQEAAVEEAAVQEASADDAAPADAAVE